MSFATGPESDSKPHLDCDDRQTAATGRDSGASGEREAIRFAIGPCSLGLVLVAATGRGIRAILLGDDPRALTRELGERFPEAAFVESADDLRSALAAVTGLIEDPARGLDLPLELRGTDFERRVWQALREIPAGVTASYSEVAARIGAPGEAFAVAEACAANVLAVAIPCHRVVRKSGALAGYRWGFRRKRVLLAREARGSLGI